MKKMLLWVLPLLVLTACAYDDTEVLNRLDGLDEKVAELEQRVDALNSELTTLSALIAGKQFISDVKINEDGSHTLTLITAAGESSSITIRDGSDGIAPKIGVRQDADGKYYWTLDGEFIIAEGDKLPVSGENGVTPRFKIEDGDWWVSYDQEATWSRLGQATGEDGTTVFKAVSLSEDGKRVFVTLYDDTVLTFDLYTEFNIAFDTTTGALRVGGSINVPFRLTGADERTVVETIPAAGWSAEASRDEGGEQGTIRVTAPVDSSTGKVIVLVNDGGYKTLVRTLTFVAGVLNVSTTSEQATSAGGPVTIEVETDLDYTVCIPEEAQSWISLSETRANEVRLETLTFNVGANPLTEPREAAVELICNGTVIETILIYQLADYQTGALVFQVEAKTYTGTNTKYTNMVYLPLFGAVNVSIDWGDGYTETTESVISTQADMPNHTYNREGLYYVTVTGGVEKLNGRMIPKTIQPAIAEIIQWGEPGMTSLEDAFYGNTSLKSVPAPEAEVFAAVTTAKSMFTGCSALETVPENLLAGATGLETVASMFYNCASLQTVPEKLFATNTKITNTGSLFFGCGKLTAVPEGLFGSLLSVDNMSSMFNQCSSLRSLPAELFKTQSEVVNIATMFKGCTALETIPEGFFDAFSKVTNMNSLFSTCPSLGNLPQQLFANMTSVTNCGYLYEKCTAMTGFPSLKSCTSLTTANALWKDCVQLTEAPADYFPESVKDGTTVAYMFQNCSALKTVPEEFFKHFAGVTIISQMFENCSSLEQLPVGLFDYMPNIKTASRTFNGCGAFTGESPYTVVDGEKIHLYDRAPENGFVALTKYDDCFKECTKIADLNLIPLAWGGQNDGTKAKPTLTLGLSSVQGAEYHAMNVSIRGTELKSGRYGLFTKERLDQFYEEMGSYEKVCNRNCIAIPSDWLTQIHSETGFSSAITTLEADTEYVLLVSGTNIHGTTVEQYSARTAPIPAGEANYERYIGTWNVTSTSSEITRQPQQFTIEIKPYRVNESYKVYNWGITTFSETAPFTMGYEPGGNVSVRTNDYLQLLGDGYYLYLKYRFYSPGWKYLIWTSNEKLVTGHYDYHDTSITLQGKEFSNPENSTRYTVCGMDYFLYKRGEWYENEHYLRPGYTMSDYGIGPYRLTKSSAAPTAATRKTAGPVLRTERSAAVHPQPGAAGSRVLK